MNKKAYLILLAIAAHSCMHATDEPRELGFSVLWHKWRNSGKKTDQTTPPTSQTSTTPTTQTDTSVPEIIISDSLSKNHEYLTTIEENLRYIYKGAIRGKKVDITMLESEILTEHAEARINDLKRKSDAAITELRDQNASLTVHNAMLTQENDALIAKQLSPYGKAAFAATFATAGVALGYLLSNR